MAEETRKTALYEQHKASGATLTTFRGWEMPLWFPSGAVAEHRVVITNVGVFDTSHMSFVTVAGAGAFDLLQLCVTKDLRRCLGGDKSPLAPGHAVFAAFLDHNGFVLDDTVVFELAHDSYLAVVNAGMGEKIAAHIETHRGNRDVRVSDLTGRVGKLDIQGPMAARLLMKVLKDPVRVLTDMDYFQFKGHFDGASPLADTFLANGAPILLSRTGYTGEFGFELFVLADHLVEAWDTLLDAGAELGAISCGLAARDSLRAGAGMPLSRQDIGPWPFMNHPWLFTLPFDGDGTGFTKRFIGDGILALRDTAEHTVPFVGNDPRKVSIHDPAVVFDLDGNEIGVVLTCVADMAIARHGDRVYSLGSPDKPADFKPSGLACGFVRVKTRLAPGRIVELKDRRRTMKVTIVDDIRPDRTSRFPMREMIS